MTGLDVRVVASAGKVIEKPLPGAGQPNPYCVDASADSASPVLFAEDAQSVGLFFTFGKFRAADLGDLVKSREFALMCPVNRLGSVDVLLGLHHGQATSNSAALVHALHPRSHHEQRHAEGRGTRRDESVAHIPGPGRFVAAAFLVTQRTGIHPAGNVHRQHD